MIVFVDLPMSFIAAGATCGSDVRSRLHLLAHEFACSVRIIKGNESQLSVAVMDGREGAGVTDEEVENPS